MPAMVIPYCRIDENSALPAQATPGAVGFDVFATRIRVPTVRDNQGRIIKERIEKPPISLLPGQRVIFGAGIIFALPAGMGRESFFCDVRPRSGLASRGIIVPNAPGTIDEDYRGELSVILENRSSEPYTIEYGERIAQLLFIKGYIPVWIEVASPDLLPPSSRGTGGLGSTGKSAITLGNEEYLREMKRWDLYFIEQAISASLMSTCIRGATTDDQGKVIVDLYGRPLGSRARYGCVIVSDERRVLSTGFNHPYIDQLCIKEGCMRERLSIPSGEQLEKCNAVHAERDAICKAAAHGIKIAKATLYCNAEPCKDCAKGIIDADISTVVALEGGYPNNGLEILHNARVEIRIITQEELLEYQGWTRKIMRRS